MFSISLFNYIINIHKPKKGNKCLRKKKMRLNEDLHQKITIALKIYIFRFFLETHSLLLTLLLIPVDSVSKGEQFYNQLTLYQTQALLRVLKKKKKKKKAKHPNFVKPNHSSIGQIRKRENLKYVTNKIAQSHSNRKKMRM